MEANIVGPTLRKVVLRLTVNLSVAGSPSGPTDIPGYLRLMQKELTPTNFVWTVMPDDLREMRELFAVLALILASTE